jgi:hypothetical protein
VTEVRPYEFKELKPKRNKYGNRKVEYRGIRFDSIIERNRYVFLEAQQNAGAIHELEPQPRFKLTAYHKHICDYVADFRYRLANGSIVVEDVKGLQSREFRIKRKLFEAMTDQPIHIVTKTNLTSLPCL